MKYYDFRKSRAVNISSRFIDNIKDFQGSKCVGYSSAMYNDYSTDVLNYISKDKLIVSKADSGKILEVFDFGVNIPTDYVLEGAGSTGQKSGVSEVYMHNSQSMFGVLYVTTSSEMKDMINDKLDANWLYSISYIITYDGYITNTMCDDIMILGFDGHKFTIKYKNGYPTREINKIIQRLDDYDIGHEKNKDEREIKINMEYLYLEPDESCLKETFKIFKDFGLLININDI